MLINKTNIKDSLANTTLKNRSPFFQPKLSINQPNDIYEQEADAMSDKVMSMPDASTNNLFFKPAISSIQRKCAHCEEEEKMQRKESNVIATGQHHDAGIQPTIMNEEYDSGIKNISGNNNLVQRQPAAPCCCCIDSVTITNPARINTAAQMGHSFNATFTLSKRTIPADRPIVLLDSCKLEWFEKTNVPYFAAGGQTANTWHDMFAMIPNSPTLAPWANRAEGCQSPQTITITDTPALGIRPGRTVARTLDFIIRVSSSDQCGCTNNSVQATASQLLTMNNGAPDWANSSFTTP